MGLWRRRIGLHLSPRCVRGAQCLWLAVTLHALYALSVPAVVAEPLRRAGWTASQEGWAGWTGWAGLRRAGDETYRLPGEAQPLHYDITLTPHLEPAFSFDGTVDIAIKVGGA